VPVALLEEARMHTMWAMAAYGAPMYCWSRRRRYGCCTLCCDRGNCTAVLRRKFTARHVGQTTGMMSYMPHAFHRDAILRTVKSLEVRAALLGMRLVWVRDTRRTASVRNVGREEGFMSVPTASQRYGSLERPIPPSRVWLCAQAATTTCVLWLQLASQALCLQV
jgi:hypothetical protein